MTSEPSDNLGVVLWPRPVAPSSCNYDTPLTRLVTASTLAGRPASSALHDRVYRLVFDDGQAWQLRLNKVHASNSAGIARVDFRIDVSTDPAPAEPVTGARA
jgi:hypothetical protein